MDDWLISFTCSKTICSSSSRLADRLESVESLVVWYCASFLFFLGAVRLLLVNPNFDQRLQENKDDAALPALLLLQAVLTSLERTESFLCLRLLQHVVTDIFGSSAKKAFRVLQFLVILTLLDVMQRW